jgi:hypothetical protein
MRRTLVLLAVTALCLSQPSRSEEPEKYELKSDYMRVDDRGSRSVRFWVDKASADKDDRFGLKMKVILIYKGKPGESEPKPLASIMFTNLAPLSSDWQFLKAHSFRCIIGEERFAFESEHDGETGDPLLEFVTAHVPISFVKKLAASDDVECALGVKTFKLDANAHDGLGALVGASVPPKK